MTTKPSEAAKRRACELVEATVRRKGWQDEYVMSDEDGTPAMIALARVLQEHSDVAKSAMFLLEAAYGKPAAMNLQTLILPDDPDPLEEALAEVYLSDETIPAEANKLRKALAKRGLQIVEASDTPKSPQDAR